MSSKEDPVMRRTKQKFVRENIDREDSEKFIEHLSALRESGGNIDKWTLDELAREIFRFKGAGGGEESNGHGGEIDFDVFPAGENRPRVEIVEVDMKRHTVTLKHSRAESPVLRKLADFDWLRSKLQLEFPFYYVPPVKSSDNPSPFIRRFLDRLFDSRLVSESQTCEAFFKDPGFGQLGFEEIKAVGPTMGENLELRFAGLKPQVAKNSAVFETYFSQFFRDHKPAQGFEDLNPLLKVLSTLCAGNATIYSHMKRVSSELSTHLSKASESLRSLAKLFEDLNRETEVTFSQIGLKSDRVILETEKRLKAGFTQWAEQKATESRLCGENLTNFFQFRKYEFQTFSNLFKDNQDCQEELRKKIVKLEAEKKKLFAAKNLAKWNIDSSTVKDDINEIVNDYNKARKYILPLETSVIDASSEVKLFTSKHLLFEFLNFTLNSQFYANQNFADLSEKLVESIQQDELIWNVFTRLGNDIAELDREGTVIIQV